MSGVCEELRKRLHDSLKPFGILVAMDYYNRMCRFSFALHVERDHGFGCPKSLGVDFSIDEREISMQIRDKYDGPRFVRDMADRIVRDVLMSFAGQLAKE